MTLGALVSFHTKHKFLILSHSRKHYDMMGKLVADGRSYDLRCLFGMYEKLIMEAMKLKSTRKKNADVLMHAMGFFKKLLTKGEKEELLETIENYRRELVPLVVPLTLIRHYVRKYDEPYLREQFYLHPHPLEVMLRNHV